MALILTRSPYFITKENLDVGATLQLDIGYYAITGDFIVLGTYNFAIFSDYGVDVSPFIADFFQNNTNVLIVKTRLNGTVNDVVQTEITNEYVATDGYGYFEDGYNYDPTSFIEGRSFYAGSNDSVQVYANGIAKIPLLHPSNVDGTVTLNYKYKGIIVDTDTLVLGGVYGDSNDLDSGFGSLVTDGAGNNIDIGDYTVVDFILTATRFVTVNKDISALQIDCIDIVSDFNANTHSLSVEYIEECKHTPYRVSFLNKLGVIEDLWFFKKSVESLIVNREKYNRFTLDSYRYGNLLEHSMKNFNVNGSESIDLNTGFVPESFQENCKQLMLSEKAFIQKGAVTLPVNINESSLEYKTHVNEKLVNYKINLNYAFHKINQIG